MFDEITIRTSSSGSCDL